MTREDVRKQFPEASEDQISALLDINSRDVGKYKKTAEDIQKELSDAKTTISELEKNKGNVEALQKVVNDYRVADEKRKAEEKAAAERSERMGRFEKAHAEVSRGAEWYNDFTRDGIFAQFETALADDAYKGKSDVQIYTALTTDEKGLKEGLYKAKIQGRIGAPMGGSPSGDNAWLQQKYKGNPFFEG